MKRIQKLAYGQLGNSTTSSKEYRKKKIGQQKPETAGAEDNITKQSNWPSARSAIYVCFWLDDFLAEPK